MRLKPESARAIHDAALRHFGADAEVWLFGSRTDDARRGGDIDLYIETGAMDEEKLLKRRLAFLAALYIALGEQRIDVVVRPRNSRRHLPIHEIAKREGLRL
ncbi:MAG: nucleotidyltransferase domain-containing protein [Gammaproteobacteria bacterium]|nr:nucleotidyltransferase domain-containing protein [Gammaproteobacteria bacterium]